MTHYITYVEAQNGLLQWLNKTASEALRTLLETKHLYQKVDFDPSKGIDALDKLILTYDEKHQFSQWTNQTLPMDKFLLPDEQPLTETIASRHGITILVLRPLHAKLFCQPCNRREAFAPLWNIDFAAQITNIKPKNALSGPAGFQLMMFVYQCQSCLGTPEGFLVRREEWTFSLQGRS